ncbi:MAG: TonB family protein [Pseudomonadota bacterium]|uniref:energy transducer TonB n=1 Tax=Roseovarius TaxID=74030 RepID=UPI0022A8493D|nr:energy transducer TonB [Roseovarius sp. EGI FJ00037]MCZ0812886.1 energy transducer TonB [Roseovarius sp. EGI FJ00037]
MKRALEFTLFIGLAAAAHLSVAAFAPDDQGAESMGQGGAAAITLQPSDARMAAMVTQWDTPPEILSAPERPLMQAPEMPAPEMRTPDVARAPKDTVITKAPAGSGLAMPEAESLPDRAVTAPPPPTVPKVKPKAKPRPKPEPAQARKPKPQPQQSTPASAAQQAKGAGNTANAGAEQRPAAVSTLSAGQRQSLLQQWGAQVRNKIERGKRYPGAARGASGTVRVRITLGRDGSLRGVALVGSSGVAALDEAAMRAVRSTRRFTPAPNGLSEANYSFTLPMRFNG